MHLFYQPDLSLGHLTEDESRHAVKVMRLEAGSEIELANGKGSFCRARITKADAHECGYVILLTTEVPPRDFFIHLAIAPTKNIDRIEWMVEKCVELGIEKISFIQCKTSERKSVNMGRIEKLVISAMKQSRQAWLPALYPLTPFEKFISTCRESSKFIAFVDSSNPDQLKSLAIPKSPAVIAIGPEGDFSADELSIALAAGFKKVGLGPTRLRTETAGLSAVMTLNLINHS